MSSSLTLPRRRADDLIFRKVRSTRSLFADLDDELSTD